MAIILCGDKCTTEKKNSNRGCGDPEVTYVGRVLHKYEINGYDDSDFVAIVWDDETDSFKHIKYASTRGWTYHNGATIDADPATLPKAEARLAELLFKQLVEKHNREANRASYGRTVKSTMSRGKNVGVTGVVKWRGEDKYKSTRWCTVYSVGIAVEGRDKLTFLTEDKVEVVAPTLATAEDEEHYRELANERAKQHNWREVSACR